MFKRILIAFDSGESAQRAMDVGLALASEQKAQVALVHVIAPPVGYVSEAAITAHRVLDDARNLARAMFKQVRSRIPDTIEVVEYAPEGDAAEEIVGTAGRWGADLIVVGTHGAGRLGSFLLGSTAQTVIRRAPCPVLVVRQQTQA